MSTDDTDIVRALRAALAEGVGQERFQLWFGPGTRLQFDGQTLTIGVPNLFFLDWIRANFRRHIETACLQTLGRCPGLQFLVDDSLHSGHPGPPGSGNGNGYPKPAARSRPGPLGAVAAGRHGHGWPAADSGGLRARRYASLEAFVPGHSRRNRLALASAEMAAQRPGEISPLLIHGPTSVGKTHLLEGISTAVRKVHPKITAIYLPAEQFTSHFLEALRGSGLPSFRRRYRGVQVLILDDLQFLAGKRATQTELLHTVEALLREQRQLVFAADRSLAELSELSPELVTRLDSGMVCRLEPPDYATRLEIVARLAKRNRIHVPQEVQQFIASRLTNHAREVSGALCRLQATSEALRQPVTLAMAEEALAEMIRHSRRPLRLRDIERAICDVFELEPASLQSPRKAKRVSHPRMLAMWLARKHTRAALSEIGQYFGRRSHSTVISAQKRVEAWVADGQSLVLAERTWAIEEAIREVERHLVAG